MLLQLMFFIETGWAITATCRSLNMDLYPVPGTTGKPVPGWNGKFIFLQCHLMF